VGDAAIDYATVIVVDRGGIAEASFLVHRYDRAGERVFEPNAKVTGFVGSCPATVLKVSFDERSGVLAVGYKASPVNLGATFAYGLSAAEATTCASARRIREARDAVDSN
jgi:hypothetical protein